MQHNMINVHNKSPHSSNFVTFVRNVGAKYNIFYESGHLSLSSHEVHIYLVFYPIDTDLTLQRYITIMTK